MSDQVTWIAKVVRKGNDEKGFTLDAKMNPKLPASERTYLAAKCAEMYAKLAGEGVLGLSEELAKKPGRILRP